MYLYEYSLWCPTTKTMVQESHIKCNMRKLHKKNLAVKIQEAAEKSGHTYGWTNGQTEL